MSDIGDRFNEIKEGIKHKKSKAEFQTSNKSDSDVNVNDNGNGNGDVNVDGNINGNGAIVISRKQGNNRVKRTYYISHEHDKEITEISKKTGRDKSEIVRLALDYFFERLKVK